MPPCLCRCLATQVRCQKAQAAFTVYADASLSPAQSHLYSPAVLMGSPRSAYTADTQVSALRAAAAHNGQAQPQQQQSAGQRGGMQQQGGQHSPSAGFCRQQLFSSSAHHSHIHAEALSHGPTDGGKNACIPERMAGGLSPQAHAGRDKPMHDVGHYLDVGQYADVGQCAGMEAGEVDARMGFPSAPQLNSTMLLAARMQHLSQIAAGGARPCKQGECRGLWKQGCCFQHRTYLCHLQPLEQ